MIEVVAAVIVRGDEILIAQRPPQKDQGGLWEFPGGKINEGETHQAALKREIREELGCEIEPEKLLISTTHHYPEKSVCLHAWRCALKSGEAIAHEHSAIAWVQREALRDYQWVPADLPIIEMIKLDHGASKG